MPIVNFTVPKTLDQRVAKTMKAKGFSSRAEFFRFAAIHFLDIIDKPFASEDERFGYLARTLSRELVARYGGQTLSSLEEQANERISAGKN